jgi:hypothetical protein
VGRAWWHTRRKVAGAITFLAALRTDRIDAPCVIDGPMNGQSFHAYVQQVWVLIYDFGDQPI